VPCLNFKGFIVTIIPWITLTWILCDCCQFAHSVNEWHDIGPYDKGDESNTHFYTVHSLQYCYYLRGIGSVWKLGEHVVGVRVETYKVSVFRTLILNVGVRVLHEMTYCFSCLLCPCLWIYTQFCSLAFAKHHLSIIQQVHGLFFHPNRR